MLPGRFYHIYTHANGFENLFWQKENFHFFLDRYFHFIPPIADTYSYCLMPNHVHFAIQILPENELQSYFGTVNTLQNLEIKISREFASLFSSYTLALNNSINRRGSLFRPNFKRKEVSSNDYLLDLIHYIHANPVNHGFVNSLDEWEWSSYHTILAGEAGPVNTSEVLDRFGGMEAFLNFHNQPFDNERLKKISPLLGRLESMQ